MRSNIARTWPSSRVPVRASVAPMAACALLAAELREEVDHRGLLLLRQPGERRHRCGRVFERTQDRGARQLVRDVRQVGAGSAVAVLADLVTGEAARLRDGELARLVLLGDLVLDLVR